VLYKHEKIVYTCHIKRTIIHGTFKCLGDLLKCNIALCIVRVFCTFGSKQWWYFILTLLSSFTRWLVWLVWFCSGLWWNGLFLTSLLSSL